MNLKLSIIVFSVCCFIYFDALSQLPAFPGAQGFGANTPGGRGGRVIAVTNLNDSGPGSFRAACEASGRRIVVFRVGGTITLDSKVKIESPYITIAGQSAPGGGICLRTVNDETPLSVKTHDVVMRYIRIRAGSGVTPEGSDTKDAFEMKSKDAHDIVIDHCSFTWGVDETVSTYSSDGGKVRNVTLQYNIIADGLDCNTHIEGCHSKGLILQYAERFSMHHNLFANNGARSPLILSGEMDLVNNVVYNWKGSAVKIENRYGDVFLNYVNNYLIPGEDSDLTEYGVQVKTAGVNLYLKGNIATHTRPNNSYPEDAIVNYRKPATVVNNRYNFPAITTTSALQAYEDVLNNVGANLPKIDRVDRDIINGVSNKTGRIIDYPSDVGGYPFLAKGTPPADRDQDGMPDQWEVAQGLNPNDATDGNEDQDGDGYTNIEEYLNGLTGNNNSEPRDCNGDIGGSAYFDDCGICVGGNTNLTPCDPGIQEVTFAIAFKKDDAEEDPRGIVDLSSSDVELAEDKGTPQTVGLRFRNVSIPQGATIERAFIQFAVDERDQSNCDLTIRGHDTNNAPVFNPASNYNISNRVTTTASVRWQPSPWNTVGEAGPNQRTPNIKTIIQEIVNRPGWRANNSMVILISGTGERTAESFDGSPNQAAKLTVQYATGSATSKWQMAEIVDATPKWTKTSKVPANSKLAIFPNPSQGHLSITGDLKDVVKVMVYDLQGKKALVHPLENTGQSTITVDTQALPQGLYVLKVLYANQASQNIRFTISE